jgi:hypothetical protein
MSKDSISLTVPLTYSALKATSEMLYRLAQDELHELPEREDTPLTEPKRAVGRLNVEADAQAKEAEEPFIDPDALEATVMQVENPVEVFGVPKLVATDLDLDANDLPWDERIHASSKTKDVKGNWKYKRGVDRDVLVPEVEAELRDTLSYGKAMQEHYPALEPAQVNEIPTPPAPPATPSTSVTTFAQLVTGITSKSIPEDKVNEAIAAVGLQNFALLGARPDLIPTVAGHLGL